MSQPCPEALDLFPPHGPYTGIGSISEQRGHRGQCPTQVLAFAIKAVSPVLPQVAGSNMDQDQQLFLCSSNQTNQSKLRPSEVCKILCDPLQCHKLSYPHAYEARIPLPPPASPSPEDPSEDTTAPAGCWILFKSPLTLRLAYSSATQGYGGSRDVSLDLTCEPL